MEKMKAEDMPKLHVERNLTEGFTIRVQPTDAAQVYVLFDGGSFLYHFVMTKEQASRFSADLDKASQNK